MDYDQHRVMLAQGVKRLFEFSAERIEKRKLPRSEDALYEALDAVLLELAKICDRFAHPDDVASANIAISSLASIWFDVDQIEKIFYNDVRIMDWRSAHDQTSQSEITQTD